MTQQSVWACQRQKQRRKNRIYETTETPERSTLRQRNLSGIPIIRRRSPIDMFPRTLLSSVGLWICSHGHLCIFAACDIIPMHSSHVETVVRLSRKMPDDRIDIDLHLDEVDTTSAEAKATYEEIKEYVLRTHGLNVSTLLDWYTKSAVAKDPKVW